MASFDSRIAYLFGNLYDCQAAGYIFVSVGDLQFEKVYAGSQVSSSEVSGPASQLQLLTASMQLGDSAGGLGLLVYRDEAGPLQTFDMKVSYGYRIRYTTKGTIGVGAGMGVRAKTMNYNDYIIKHPDDALLGDGKVTQVKPDLSLGYG